MPHKNPEARREYQRQYRDENREARREQGRQFKRQRRAENPDMMNAYQRAWSQENPDKVRKYNEKYREKKRIRERQSFVEGRLQFDLDDGIILVGSDAHYRPGEAPSTAHSALLRLARELSPDVIVMNGDLLDAPSVSKHSRIGWEKRPTLAEELGEVDERLAEIEAAAPEAMWIWPLGNHDARFETYIAENAAEFEGVHGVHLKDHFPTWQPCWSVRINPDSVEKVIIKHRYGGGATAVMTNLKRAVAHYITGHTHAANTWSWTNEQGTFYSADTGTLANPYSPTFAWMEDRPRDWRSAVTVLTIMQGCLLPPEQLLVIDQERRLTTFRGQVHQEKE